MSIETSSSSSKSSFYENQILSFFEHYHVQLPLPEIYIEFVKKLAKGDGGYIPHPPPIFVSFYYFYVLASVVISKHYTGQWTFSVSERTTIRVSCIENRGK
jgi:hypothetical protein